MSLPGTRRLLFHSATRVKQSFKSDDKIDLIHEVEIEETVTNVKLSSTKVVICEKRYFCQILLSHSTVQVLIVNNGDFENYLSRDYRQKMRL